MRSFQSQVEQRRRVTNEIFAEAVQALVVRVRDDELEALLLEAQGPGAPSCIPRLLPAFSVLDPAG